MRNCILIKKYFWRIVLLGTLPINIIGQTPRPVPANYSSTIPRSYIRSWDATAPEQDPNTLMARLLKDVKQATQYFDGLGRPLQTVLKQGSLVTGSSPTDIVSPVEYDGYEKEPFKYLPYAEPTANDGLFKLNPFQQQAAFMQSQYSSQSETWFYGQTNFEASPLNRVQEAFAPGNSWAGTSGNGTEDTRRSIKMKHWINTATDDVKKWYVTDVTNGWGTYAINNNYPAGDLYKTLSVDEHAKQVIEFKDREGKVILKKVQLTATADAGPGSDYTGWLCTYYIYDDLGNLRCVIQPKGVELLVAGSWSLTTSILDEQCFRYEYDARNRMIMKKVPGAGEVYMIYDARDRLVMTQDANLRNAQPYPQWLFILYDDLARPIKTGTISTVGTFADHRAAAYNSTSYPNINNYINEIFSETFYDNYDWLAANGNPFSNNRYTGNDYVFLTPSSTYPYPQALSQSNQLKGMITGTKTKVLGTSTYMFSISFYDDKGRMLQTQSHNVTGCTDITSIQYNFSGQVLIKNEEVNKCGTPNQHSWTTTKYEYDDLGRLLTVKKSVTNGIVSAGETIIAQNEYDALGQLKKKKLAPAYNSNAGLETENFEYNIRGWMLGMNRDYAKDVNNNNFFGFDLGYDKANNNIIGGQTYTTPQFNGNIEGMVWKSKGDGEKRKYDFTYDAVNRLTSADFNQYTSGTFNKTANVDFSLSGLSFDANGNILTMNQKGLKLASSSFIDQLTYTYQSNSNKLQQVTDASNDNISKLGDFKYDPATKTSTDYTYDVNGNLSLDNNKKISSITYNHLNLPSVITVTGKGTISYTYDAAGNKLKKVTTEGSTVTTTLYLGDVVYKNDTLQFISTEEGRIRFNSTSNSFAFDYFLKDHLGNVRMVLTEEQKQDIYPAATLEGTYSDGTTAVGYEKNFYTINTDNVVDASGIPAYQNNNGIANPYPAGNSGNTNVNANSAKVYRLLATTSGGVNGLGMTLKVMSGDKIDIMGKSYYATANSGGSNYNVPVLDIITGLLGATGGTAASKGYTATDLNGQSGITTPISSFLSDVNRGSGTVPKAYINWILFDENFKYVSGNFSRVGSAGTVKPHYGDASMQNIQVTKNGYLYVYVSNESPVAVFFDNLQVLHTRGPLLEETHYYPFGLTMNGISSKALNFGNPQNKAKFNNIELNNDFDLNMYDAHYRNLDPQIGRFWQLDPRPTEMVSSYAAMLNNPILFSDPMGDTTWVYNQNGVFLGVVNDKLKNQVDFVKTDGNGGTPFDASKLSAKDAKALGKAFRNAAFAFMGSNTVADMEKIAKAADAKGFELGFVAQISESKEIRLTALPDKYHQGDNKYDLIGAIDGTYSKEQQANLFAVGHVHNAKHSADVSGYDGYTGIMAKFLATNQPSTTNNGQRTYPDFQPFLYRHDPSTNSYNKGQTPAFLISAYGVTTYGTGTGYGGLNNAVQNPVEPNRYNSYNLYQQLKR